MKTLICALLLIAATLSTSAHIITPGCWANGRFTFSGTQFENNQWVNIHINTAGVTFSNGSQDSSFKTTSTSFIFSIPQPVRTTIRNISVKYNTTGSNHTTGGTSAVNSPANTTTISCGNLPVLLSGFTVQKSSTGILALWTTNVESNNDHFEVEGSNDGINFVSLGRVNAYTSSGNSDVLHNYSLAINWETQAGFGLIGILLFGSLAVGLFKRKAILLPIFIGLFLTTGITSCSKSNSVAKSVTKYSIYRLKQVDKDGVITYYYQTN